MSLRAESIKSYRQLYRAASMAAMQCPLYNQVGLQQYVSQRFQQDVEQNRRKIGIAMQEIEAEGKKALSSTKNARMRDARQIEKAISKQQKKLLRQYEQYVSQQIDRTRNLAALLPEAIGDEKLTSVLQVLAAGVGNVSYQRTMESNFVSFFEFEQKRTARDETTEEATSERQNRIMQQALLPYGERLLLAHRAAIGEGNRGSSLPYLSPWQATEAIVGTRSGVTAHHLKLGRDHIVVEIDETYNKQIIYVCCTRAEGMDSGSYNWDQEVERVDVSESEEVRQTMFHGEFLLIATRLCDALVHETPLHPTRKTVLVGHAVGGAVAVVMSLILIQRSFDINNVITFGAPKSMQGTLDRYVSAINPIRVVLSGDPLVELPVTGTEGDPFVHAGEILLMDPSAEAGGQEDSQALRKRQAQARSDFYGEEEVESRDASAMTAEDLAAAMMDDSPDDNNDTSPSSNAAEPEDVGAAEDEEDIDLRELCRVAEERYKKNFLVENYIKHLSDSTVELTYAEGDEVWDEGEFTASMREAAAEPLVAKDERRERDLRGAL